MTLMSNEFDPVIDPSLAAAIDDVWLEQGRRNEAEQILTSLRLLAEGYFTDGELAFAPFVGAIPMGEEDPELAAIPTDDIDAWNAYCAKHPELGNQGENLERLFRAKQALEDNEAVAGYPGTPLDNAIKLVVKDREEKIRYETRLLNLVFGIGMRHIFGSPPDEQQPEE